MGGVVRADPARLEAFTDATVATIEPTLGEIDECSAAVSAYNAAPKDLGGAVEDLAPAAESALVVLGGLDQMPAAFAAALRALDGSASGVLSADLGQVRAFLGLPEDQGPPGLPEWLAPFLFGDVANFWGGGEQGFPYGALGAGGLRVFRTQKWMRAVARLGASSDEAARLFPTFNTGLVGRGLTAVGSRVPVTSVANGARWLQTAGATRFFTRVGIVGGVVGTGLGAYDLIQQGNPIDAFEREGAGYVADVAQTAFSASSTAFFVAPNPVTGALVIGTGVVWAGAEVVDHWDDIVEFGGDAVDAGEELVSDIGDGVSDVVDAGGDALDGIGDFTGLW